MGHRAIVSSSRTGKVSLLQARKAAAAVKSTSRRSVRNRGRSDKGSPALNGKLAERYLGHFGGPSSKGTSNSQVSSGHKPSGKKGLRRAS